MPIIFKRSHIHNTYASFWVSPQAQKTTGAEKRKEHFWYSERAHFLFPKALINLKVYDIFNI